MRTSVDLAASYPNMTIGDRFADHGMADARASVTAMIEAAGVKGKVVALIIPNEYRPDTRVHLNAHGRQLVTLWGRTPATDEGTVK